MVTDVDVGGDFTLSVYQGTSYQRPDYLRDVSALLAFYRERFVAREPELAHIAEVVGRPEPGYLLVEAPGGFGKSVLCAQVVDRVLDGRWAGPAPTLACFFIRADGTHNTTAAFLRAVNGQLLDHLNLAGGTPPDLAALQAQLSQLWSEAVRRATAERPLLLVVDGLDEMAAEKESIAGALPGGLADHVHVLVSSRVAPDPRRLVLLEHPLRRADTVDLQAFGEEAVRLLIEHYGIAGLDRGPARILALTRGEPLFARFVCETVGRDGPAELDRLEKDPPADAEDYFRDQLSRLEDAELGDVSWEVLGALVVAHGGMTEKELATALGHPGPALQRALKPIRRFLLGDERLDIFHRRLSDLVADLLDWQLDGLRERLVDWCRGYGRQGWPEETPRYVLEHCAEHYAESDPPALVALPDRARLVRQRAAMGTVARFVGDVRLAVAAADPEQLVRLCVIGGNVVSMASTVPAPAIRVLAHCGAEAEARERAGLASEDQRRAALTELGAGLLAAGHAGGARDALSAAVELFVGATFPLGDVGEFVRLVEVAADDAALVRRLLDVALSIGGQRERAKCLGALAAPLRRQGEGARAEAALRSAAREPPEDTLLSRRLATLAVGAGEAHAGELLDELADAADSPFVLGAVAEGWARTGDVPRALGLAADVDAAYRRERSADGEIDWLYETILVLEHPALQDLRRELCASAPVGIQWASADQVRALGAAGGLPALAAAEREAETLDAYSRDSVLGMLAPAYGDLGEGEHALRCLRGMRLGDGSFIDDAVPGAAAALAAAGRFDDAYAVADVAVYPSARGAALAAVAAARLAGGDPEGALADVRRAIRAAESIDDRGAASVAYAALARHFFATGDAARAGECAERARAALAGVLPLARDPRYVLPTVDVLVRAGRLEEALALVDEGWGAETRLGAIALAYANAGDRARGVALAERAVLEAPEGAFLWADRARALLTAAAAFRAAGLEDHAAACMAEALATDADDDEDFGPTLVRGLRGLDEHEKLSDAVRRLVAPDSATHGLRARIYAAAGMSDEAAEAAALALEAPADEGAEGMRVIELAALLRGDAAVAALEQLRDGILAVAEPEGRAEALAAVAAALHEHDPDRAGAVLGEAFRAGWAGGREVVMHVVSTGPLPDMAPGLPERVAEWIAEIDGWW